MGESGDGYWSHLEVTLDTGAGPAAAHGPAAEPDGPPLRAPAVVALGALVALAAADGVTVQLEHSATRGRRWPSQLDLPAAWLKTPDGVETGLMAFDPTQGWAPESAAEEAFRVADTAQEAVLESMPSVGRPTNWPPCPHHPTTHPLALAPGDDDDPRPRWTCPLTGHEVGPLDGGGIPSTP